MSKGTYRILSYVLTSALFCGLGAFTWWVIAAKPSLLQVLLALGVLATLYVAWFWVSRKTIVTAEDILQEIAVEEGENVSTLLSEYSDLCLHTEGPDSPGACAFLREHSDNAQFARLAGALAHLHRLHGRRS